jgi:hypothetical protein
VEKLRASLTILGHSFDVMRRHPRLLFFPLAILLAMLLAFVPLLRPLFAVAASGGEIDGGPWSGGWPLLWLLPFSLWMMFITTFVQVALYSQIIEAMNGGQVSLARGFAVARGKLRAIIAWSLLAGTVGALISAIQERIGSTAGRWITALAGMSWYAACIFVVPIIINEPQTRSPIDYLKTSTALVKRVWGEGVIGFGGFFAIYIILGAACGAVISLSLLFVDPGMLIQVYILTSLGMLGMFMFLYLATQIFECGLYVYATEGVAPGTFDEELFERTWTVKPGAGSSAGGTEPARRRHWRKLRLALPVVFTLAAAGGPLLLRNFAPESMRSVGHAPYLGSVMIDLKQLDYRFGLQDLQAAGLFVGDKCRKCDFSPGGSMKPEGHTGADEDGFQATLHRFRDHLTLHFYGEYAAPGRQRFKRTANALQARFAGHTSAISVTYGQRVTWDAVPGATSYAVEMECPECCAQGRGCSRNDANGGVVKVKEPAHGFTWTHGLPGRWRVRAVFADGSMGPMSEWREFHYSE